MLGIKISSPVQNPCFQEGHQERDWGTVSNVTKQLLSAFRGSVQKAEDEFGKVALF